MSSSNQFTPQAEAGHGVALPAGLELGDYRILRHLGQGGFGITYLVEDMQSGEQLVLKENMPTFCAYRNDNTLTVQPLTPGECAENYRHTLTRFVQEARILARLHHPNIVRVLRAFEALGTAYYVMPYIAGQELHKAAPAVVDEAWLLPILRAVLEALDYLHSQDLLHRDLKPGNILLREDGTPILIDFGTARALQSESSATMVGTPGYTPIEQITPHGKRGAWTDIYSLGATCYRLITGQRPPDAVERIDEEDPYRPLALRAELRGRFSATLLQSVDTALAVRAKKRWQSAQAWLHALDSAVVAPASLPRMLPPVGVDETVLIPAQEAEPKKNRRPVLILLCLLALIIPVAYGLYSYAESAQEAKRQAQYAEEQLRRAQMLQAAREQAEREQAAREEAERKAQLAREQAEREEAERQARLAREEAERKAQLAREQACEDYITAILASCHQSTDPKLKDLPAPPPSEVADTLRALAENQNQQAQFALALVLTHGLGVAKDESQANQWLRKAADAGLPIAQTVLGRRYSDGLYGLTKDAVEALKWFRKAVEQGDAQAQYNLGFSYANGEGVAKDAEEAVKWYSKAAEQGYVKAQNNLGGCYANGEGVEKDAEEAVKWYRKAAEQGHATAQYNLGGCYVKGSGVEKDAEEAVKWYRKAAEQGDADAQYNLGVCYYNGSGVEKDAEEAVKWFRLAAEQGNAMAQYNLGWCYYNGSGVAKDAEEAVKWFRKAAEQGNASAQCHLGVCYEFGKGVAKDAEEAVKWYRKAAEQGYADAQCNLGWCYYVGIGVKRDRKKAKEWFRKSAEQGHERARKILRDNY
ncbi:MAG: SEL1-like repeat protein [Akkermansia sp.]|nr:SEL1-like repeat protein [Akkermansia sp.]